MASLGGSADRRPDDRFCAGEGVTARQRDGDDATAHSRSNSGLPHLLGVAATRRGLLRGSPGRLRSVGDSHHPLEVKQPSCFYPVAEPPLNRNPNYRYYQVFLVEPAGIEPATSCLQSRSDCPLVSRSVAQMPANAAFPLATGGLERTARDKLVPPWCPPSAFVTCGGGKRAGPRLPGCVSSRMRPRSAPLLRRRSPSAHRGAAYPQTRPSRGHTC